MNNEEELKRLKLLSKLENEFSDIYQSALNLSYVRKPVSYSLYQLWKKWDAKEKERR